MNICHDISHHTRMPTHSALQCGTAVCDKPIYYWWLSIINDGEERIPDIYRYNANVPHDERERANESHQWQVLVWVIFVRSQLVYTPVTPWNKGMMMTMQWLTTSSDIYRTFGTWLEGFGWLSSVTESHLANLPKYDNAAALKRVTWNTYVYEWPV